MNLNDQNQSKKPAIKTSFQIDETNSDINNVQSLCDEENTHFNKIHYQLKNEEFEDQFETNDSQTIIRKFLVERKENQTETLNLFNPSEEYSEIKDNERESKNNSKTMQLFNQIEKCLFLFYKTPL